LFRARARARILVLAAGRANTPAIFTAEQAQRYRADHDLRGQILHVEPVAAQYVAGTERIGLRLRPDVQLFVHVDVHRALDVAQTAAAFAMDLHIDASGDFEHVAGRVHVQLNLCRLREAYALERFQGNLLLHRQMLPSAGEQTTDIDLVRRSHNIEEGPAAEPPRLGTL